MRRATSAATLLAALTLATSCADPYEPPERRRQPSPPPGEQPAPALSTHTDSVAPQHLAATPEQAARRAAELTTNWTGETAAGQYAQLARTTVGAAHREARESAARLPTDPQLSEPQTKSVGTVVAVATRDGQGAQRQLIVVTHEMLTGDGLREEQWRVTLATAERRSGGWVISRWDPQP